MVDAVRCPERILRAPRRGIHPPPRRRTARWLAVCAAVLAATLTVAACSGSSHHPASSANRSDGATTNGVPAPGGKASGRPNIVFVLTDDLSMNLVKYMPHVLALEKRGMTFSNYSVTDSLCCPSRSSIFTGQFPHDTKIYTNSTNFGGFVKFKQLGEESHTFATQLKGTGYRTALMGKYLNGYYPSYPQPAAQSVLTPPNETYVPPGWSEWDVAGSGYVEYKYALNHDHTVEYHATRPSDYLTSVIQNRAVSFVNHSAADRRPFLLELATFSPHLPATPAPRDLHTFRSVTAPRTTAFDRLPLHAARWLRVRAALTPAQIHHIDLDFRKRVRAVQSVDRMIATIEQTVKRAGQANNTVFVFSSDNGFHMGEHRLDEGKLTAFETDIHVPLVVAGPGIPAGVVNNDIVENIDLAPTFESLAGTPIQKQTDGRSLVPLLYGAHPAWRTLAAVEHRGPVNDPGDPDLQSFADGNPPSYVALRGPRYTYVQYADGEREYYDRRVDPREMDNIYYQLSPSAIATLDAQVQALHTCHGPAACWAAGLPRGG